MLLKGSFSAVRRWRQQPKQTFLPVRQALLIMKFTAIALLSACLTASASGFSQTVTLSERNVSLEKVFKEIKRQTGYVFFFDEALIREEAKVTINVKKVPLDQALQACFGNRRLTYSIVENTIVIKAKVPDILFELADLPPPPITVTGRVTNSRGEVLQGVSITIKGTNIGTTTDAQGNFSIAVPDASSKVLVFSFIGMSSREMEVTKNTSLAITLEEELNTQEEIVVRGYGTQKKANLTGSVASIGADVIANRPVTNISQAIQGQLPGVQVVTPGGQPGRDQGRIKIRGLGTMNNADPMVVVDGLVVPSWEDLNPNDIENITVLKDASAASIYGSRAANGVIIITTKRGKTGTPTINYNGYVGKQSFTALPKFLNSYDYALLLNEGLRNEGASERYDATALEGFRKTVQGASDADPFAYPNTDWLDLLYQGSGLQHSHNVSLSGGTESARYLLSLGYLDQQGLIKNTNSNRYNVRFNMDSKISDRLNVGITTTMSRQKIEEPSRGLGFIISQLERVPPTEPNKYPDGTWARYIDGNHIRDVEEGGLLKSLVSHINGNVFAELKLIKGLRWRTTAGIDYNVIDNESHGTDVTFGNGVYQGPNTLTDAVTRSTRATIQSFLNYQTSVGNHNIGVLAGTESESNRLDYNDAYRQNFPGNALTELNAGALTGLRNSGYNIENRLSSYFGRVNYDFKGKYLLEGSFRYDGSSKFAKDRRWGFFPAFSAGWRISQESFMLGVNAISDLKLRVSYGSVGNNATSDYQFIPRIALGQNYPFFNSITAGAAQTTASNPNLEWEKSTSFNIGLDLGLFRNKLNVVVDVYDRYTDNILIAIPVSPLYGLPAPTVNAGAMRNKGVEFSVGYRDTRGDFSYNVLANLALNKNEVEKFPNPVITTREYQYQTIKKEGYEWDAFYGYEVDGIYQTDEQVASAPKVPGSPVQKGDLMFRDQNKDGVINGDDRVVLGSEIPGVTFGLNLGVAYKNFDLNLFGQGVTDFHQKITLQYMTPFNNGGKAMVNHLDRWTPETPNSRFPRTHVTQQFNYATQNSLNIVDATYFRLKNLQLGYTFSENITSKLRLGALRAYLSCQNLFTITKLYDGIDPEAATVYAAGYDGKYNNVRTLTFGLNLTL